MLDAGLACAELRGEGGWHIYWGAYLGTKDEAAGAGALDDVLDEIQRTRRELRERQGLDHGHLPAPPRPLGRAERWLSPCPVWAARPARCTEA